MPPSILLERVVLHWDIVDLAEAWLLRKLSPLLPVASVRMARAGI